MSAAAMRLRERSHFMKKASVDVKITGRGGERGRYGENAGRQRRRSAAEFVSRARWPGTFQRAAVAKA